MLTLAFGLSVWFCGLSLAWQKEKAARACICLALKNKVLLGNIQNQLKDREDWKYGGKNPGMHLKADQMFVSLAVGNLTVNTRPVLMAIKIIRFCSLIWVSTFMISMP